MKMLSKSQIIALHGMAIRQTGGSAGLRDEGALDAALAAPFQTFGGNALYPSIKAQIARLCYGLIQNHPFVDGNKRTGMLVLLVCCEINGMAIEISDEEIIELGLSLASGKMDCQALTQWLVGK